MKFKKVLAILLATIAIIEGLVLPIPTCVRAAVEYWVDVTANQVYLHKEPYADSERVVPVCKGDVLHIVGSSENKYGNQWLKVIDGSWIFSGHTKAHTKHHAVKCGMGSTSYEFYDADYHNKVVYSGDDLCVCGSFCGEGTYKKQKERHFFKNRCCIDCGYQAVYDIETFSESVFIQVVVNGTPIYAEPTRYSDQKGTLNDGAIVECNGKVENMYGNTWFTVTNGFVYSGNIGSHIHKGVMSSPSPVQMSYSKVDESRHSIAKTYHKLCECGYIIGNYSESSQERHNFDSNNCCVDCHYQRPVSIMLPEPTPTEPEPEPEPEFEFPHSNEVCLETKTIKGEKIDQYIDQHLNSHSFIEVYEKFCPTCGELYSSGRHVSPFDSVYHTESRAEAHNIEVNEYGESVCTVCGFNITQALLANDETLSQMHLSLSTVGMLPVFGEAFDLIDGALYLLEGEYAEAGLSAMSLIPIVGNGSGALKIADAGSDVIRSLERKKELAKMLDKGIESMDDIFTEGHHGYRSYASFKYHEGRAGYDYDMEWHHLVEQVQGKTSRSGFDSELINNTANMIPLTKAEHRKISSYYSSIYNAATGMTVRDYMNTLSFEEQYEFGLKALRDLGIIP